MNYMTESELFLIDTNILVYAAEKGESPKIQKAKKLVNRCWQGEEILAVSSQNLAEFVFVTTKRAKLSFEEAKTFAGFVVDFHGFKKIGYNAETVLAAIEMANEFKTSFWDSLLAATMRENGIFNIYTENTKDFKIPWINAVNPFNQ